MSTCIKLREFPIGRPGVSRTLDDEAVTKIEEELCLMLADRLKANEDVFLIRVDLAVRLEFLRPEWGSDEPQAVRP